VMVNNPTNTCINKNQLPSLTSNNWQLKEKTTPYGT
jgi:hypothetical protein